MRWWGSVTHSFMKEAVQSPKYHPSLLYQPFVPLYNICHSCEQYVTMNTLYLLTQVLLYHHSKLDPTFIQGYPIDMNLYSKGDLGLTTHNTQEGLFLPLSIYAVWVFFTRFRSLTFVMCFWRLVPAWTWTLWHRRQCTHCVTTRSLVQALCCLFPLNCYLNVMKGWHTLLQLFPFKIVENRLQGYGGNKENCAIVYTELAKGQLKCCCLI